MLCFAPTATKYLKSNHSRKIHSFKIWNLHHCKFRLKWLRLSRGSQFSVLFSKYCMSGMQICLGRMGALAQIWKERSVQTITTLSGLFTISFPVKGLKGNAISWGKNHLGKLHASHKYGPNIARVAGSLTDLFILWQPGTDVTLSGSRLRLMGYYVWLLYCCCCCISIFITRLHPSHNPACEIRGAERTYGLT